jgi:hypothetical protein
MIVAIWVLVAISVAVLAVVLLRRRAKTPPIASITENTLTESEKERMAAVSKQSRAFVGASMLMVDKQILNSGKTQQIGACLYVVGAVDYLCQHYKLDNNSFLIASREALKSFGVSEPEEFARRIPQIAADPFGKAAMTEGGRAIQAWLSGADKNAPLKLFELVRQWVAKPEQGFG